MNPYETTIPRLPFCPLWGKLRSSQNSEFSETERNFGETQDFFQENLQNLRFYNETGTKFDKTQTKPGQNSENKC